MADPALAHALATQRVALSDGTEIPVMGLGTYRLTGSDCERIVRFALETGYRHIDTALIYENQREIARALFGYSRADLYLTSKLWPGDLTKERVPKACDQILRELKTDYVDLLLIHWPERGVALQETIEAMQKLKEAGKVRSIGVSNFTIRHLKEILPSPVPLVTNQVEFHVYLYQHELQEFCAQQKMVITAYAPLARGELARDEQLKAIGAKHGKSAIQVGLRWLIQKGCVVIPKSATPERILENADIFNFQLSDEELHTIDALNQNRRLIVPEVADFD